MDEQQKAWKKLHLQRINRIDSLERYGIQYKQYFIEQQESCPINKNGLRIYPVNLIQWVELFAAIDGFFELILQDVSIEGRYLSSFCKHFTRNYEALLYNKPLKKQYANKIKSLNLKMASILARQCFRQEFIVVANTYNKASFHYRLKQFVWLMANMILLVRQEGILALSSDSQIMKNIEHDKITPFLKYGLGLVSNGHRRSAVITRLDLKYLELFKDASNNVEDLKVAYFIKNVQPCLIYGSDNVLWNLCCDMGELSNGELKQLYKFLSAAGIVKEQDT